jgi:hypothetical protein
MIRRRTPPRDRSAAPGAIDQPAGSRLAVQSLLTVLPTVTMIVLPSAAGMSRTMCSTRPAAVVLSIEDLESLEETLDVMSNTRLVADIREALAELDTGAAQVLSKDEARRLIADQ